ncbi:MAG: acetate--CoA ligase family protein [Desulfobacterales bacterium]|nr:acetate--CoA ligase family protein [Desulfobacterales bacterium]
MLKKSVRDILSSSRKQGWVMEPEAKRLLALEGLAVPKFTWSTERDEALRAAQDIGYPVAAKIVSPAVLHKSERNGVVTNINSDQALGAVYDRFSALEGFAGILIEEMLAGIELIVGAKIDYQFGPVILLGIGGTLAEIYQDTSLRMAPLMEKDVVSMIRGLRAHQLLEGFRGAAPVNLKKLTRLMMAFSRLVMKLEDLIESIDLNPVMCSARTCVIADARIILSGYA